MQPRPPLRRSATPSLTTLRSQIAFVRALLDEIERLAPENAELLTPQLVEELTRLGGHCAEAARSLAETTEDDSPASRCA